MQNTSGISIRYSGMGIEVIIEYVTDLGNVKAVLVTVDRQNDTINPAMNGSLNKAGREALKDAITQAELILKYGIMLPSQAK